MNFDDLLSLFQDNPILNVVFLVVALIGVFATIFFYVKSIRKREPTFSIRSINLVLEKINKIDGLEISFQEEKIDNLSVSKIAFYNNGKETIRRDDIAPKDPIRIIIDNKYKILDADILFQKKQANNFEIKNDGKQVEVLFDYIDYAEGAVFQLIHTGKSSDDLEIKGTVFGSDKIKEKSLSKSLIRRIIQPPNEALKKIITSKKGRPAFIAAIFIAPIILLLVTFFSPEYSRSETPSFWIKALPVLITIILYWGMGISLVRARPPKGFDVYDDEYLAEKSIEFDKVQVDEK